MKKDKKASEPSKEKDKASKDKKDKKDSKDDDGEKQRIAKLEATIQSLQSDQLPALRVKLQSANEASKVLKAAQKCLKLSTIDLFGVGVCDGIVKDLCQTLRSATALTYLGLRNYAIDANPSYTDLLKVIAQHKQLSTLHIDLLVSTKLKVPELLPVLRDSLNQNNSITKFSYMGHGIRDAGVSLLAPWVSSNTRLKFLDLSTNGVTEDGLSTLCAAITDGGSVKALHMQKTELSTGRYANIFQSMLTANTSLTRLDISHSQPMNNLASVTSFFNSFASAKNLVSLGLNDVQLGNDGAAVIFKMLSDVSCSLKNVRMNDNQITKMDALNWDTITLDEFHFAGNPVGDAPIRRLTRALRSNHTLRSLNIGRCNISEEALKEFVQELQFNLSLTSVSLRKDDEGKGLDATGMRWLQRNANTQKLLDALSTPVTELPPPEVVFPFGNKSVYFNWFELAEESALARLVKKLPSDTAGCATALYLARNKFTEFPFVPLLQFTALTHLDVSANKLTSLPPDVGNMKSLTSLDVRNNKLETLPLLLGKLNRLKHLYVQCNKLASIPVSILENCPIETLALEGNPIPPGRDLVYREWSRTSLNLANMGLKYMPREIATLPKLKELLLADNQLVTLPHEIGMLKTLTLLDLSRNRIEHLPWQLGKLASLQVLKLAGNPLTTLPESLRIPCGNRDAVQFSELRDYLLSLAKSKSVPLRTRLVILGSQKSGKTSLAKALGGGDSAPIGRIQSGQMREAPIRDMLLRPRQSMDEAVPSSAAAAAPKPAPSAKPQRGLFEQMEDLSKTKTKDETFLRKASEVDMSESQVDLQITRLSLPSLRAATPGAETPSPKTAGGSSIGRSSSSQSREMIHFDVWDITGDETTNVSSTFFITKRTVYLLVFNASQPIEQQYHALDYWMAAISSRAPKCPVMLVGTHTDSKKVTSDAIDALRDQLDKRYCQHFSISVLAMLSTKTNKGVPELQELLVKEVAQLSFASEPISDMLTCLDYQLRQMALELSTPLISTTKFGELAQQCGVGPHLVTSVLDTLHDLGALLYVRGSRAARNAKAIILGPSNSSTNLSMAEGSSRRSVGDSDRESERNSNVAHNTANELHAGIIALDPIWLSNVFRSLHQRLAGKDGTLLVADAPSIWGPPQHPPGSAQTYLELLEKFEMTFPLQQPTARDVSDSSRGQSRLLVPMLLPAEPPSGLNISGYLKKEGAGAPVFTRVYKMPFLPQGLFAHVLVRSLTIAQPVNYWRSGVILQSAQPRSVAAITTDLLTTITLSVTGGNSGSLLLQLANAIDALLQIFIVNVESLVQCSCSSCVKNDKPHLFTVAELTSCYMTTPDTPVKCKLSQQDVPLASVAPDLTLLSSFVLNFTSIKKGKQIGRGGFATVYEATSADGTTVALKELSDKAARSPEGALQLFNEFRQEAFTWNGFRHENVLRLLGVCLRPLSFVMEIAVRGTLHEYLRANTSLNWDDRMRLAKDVVKGLQYLHNQAPPILHRDLKSHNVLISLAADKRTPVAKLADFGVCVAGTMAIGRVVDNPVWLAPEIMLGKDYGAPADIYSLGIVLWEIVTAKEPFAEFNFQLSSMLEDQILLGLRPTIPDKISEPYAALVRRCWHRQPSLRPTANEVLPTLDALNIAFRL